jgi:hypothetical protein
MRFDINIITPGGGGHVLTVHQEHKDRLPQLVVIAGEPCESLAVEAMMERLMGEPLEFTEIQL